MINDPELYQKHSSYFRWTNALWTHYFVDRPGLRVRLSVDDDEIDRIGRSLEIANPRTSFILAVRSFVELYDGIDNAAIAADRIGRSVGADAPGFLGILAACVLVASRMAGDSQYAGNAYFPRFNRDVLGLEWDSRPKGFEDLGKIWSKLRNLLARHSGRYGILGLPNDATNTPLRNRPNINLPLSQCLFRRADLDRLDEILREWSQMSLDGESAFTELTQHVKMWPERFTVALRKNIAIASKDGDLKVAYVDELQDLLSNIASVAALAGRRREERTGNGSARVRLFPRRGPGGRVVYDLALEVGRGDDWQPAEDVRLESGDVIGRIRTVFADREYRYSGSNPQVFIEGANGDCLSARAPRLPAFGRVVVVCTAAFVDEILTFATRITQTPALPNGDVRVLPLMERFKLLNALSFHFSSKATENTSLPLCLSRFSLFGRFHVRLVGGLAFENSFLPGALPLVEALWEGTGKAPAVYCDEMELKGVQRQDRLEYDLPEAANKIGLHIVSAADGSRLAFNVAAPMRRYESSDPDDAPNVAMYFGPEFLRWVRSAREIKLARKQSGGENATAFLLQGARIFEKDARSQN